MTDDIHRRHDPVHRVLVHKEKLSKAETPKPVHDPIFDQKQQPPSGKYHPDNENDFRPASGDGK